MAVVAIGTRPIGTRRAPNALSSLRKAGVAQLYKDSPLQRWAILRLTIASATAMALSAKIVIVPFSRASSAPNPRSTGYALRPVAPFVTHCDGESIILPRRSLSVRTNRPPTESSVYKLPSHARLKCQAF